MPDELTPPVPTNGSPAPQEPKILTSPPPGATPPLTAEAIASAVASAIGGALKPQFDALFAVARGKDGKDKTEQASPQPPSPTTDVEQLRRDWAFDKALTSSAIDDRSRSMLQRLYDAEKPGDPGTWLAEELKQVTPTPLPPAPGHPAPAGADADVSTSDSILNWTKADLDRFVLANGGDPSDPLNIKNKAAYEKVDTLLKAALKDRKIRLRPE